MSTAENSLADITKFVAAISESDPSLLSTILAHFDQRESERRQATRLGCEERRQRVKRTSAD